MFVTAVRFLFLLKLKWPKNKNIYDEYNGLKVFTGDYMGVQGITGEYK